MSQKHKDLKTFKTKVEDCSLVKCIDMHQVTICKTCQGIGWYERTEEVGRDEYETELLTCGSCKGDGRIVQITRKIIFEADADEVLNVPFVDFNGDPWLTKEIRAKVKFDYRNPRLEGKYPELQKLTYENYDKKLEKYETLDHIERSPGANNDRKK
jgi:hypothetical protein